MNRDKMREVENKLRCVNLEYGFREVYVPIMNDYDIYQGSILDKHLYRCVNGKEIEVLRADYTTALVASFSKDDEKLPKKIAYYGEVFRKDKPKNYRQIGVEYFGGDEKETDFLITELVFKYIKTIGITKGVFCINYLPLVNMMIERLNLKDSEEKEFKKSLLDHNYVDVQEILSKRLSSKDYELVWKLFNEREILKALDIINKVFPEYIMPKAVVELFHKFNKQLIFDIGLVKNLDYYTGLVFEVYVPNVANPIISGGRYDDLSKRFNKSFPAIGFALDANYLGESK